MGTRLCVQLIRFYCLDIMGTLDRLYCLDIMGTRLCVQLISLDRLYLCRMGTRLCVCSYR